MTWSAADDARIRAWLQDDVPGRAPASILEATFARTGATSPIRLRSRWREPRVAMLLAAALAAAVLVGGAVVVALSRPPGPMPNESLAQPRFLGDFLWDGGYELVVEPPPPGVIDPETVAATAAGPDLAPYLGPPDPPMFGRLRCVEPGLCGTESIGLGIPPDRGTVGTWSVWIVEYPQEGAYRVVQAWDGRLITGWDGLDLQSCSPDEVGTEPLCTEDVFAPVVELPANVRAALAVWGQLLTDVEHEYSTHSVHNGSTWPDDAVDPSSIAATLVDGDPQRVDAVQGTLACQRAACEDAVVKEPGELRTVAIIVIDDGARWAIVDAATGEVLADDRTPVEP